MCDGRPEIIGFDEFGFAIFAVNSPHDHSASRTRSHDYSKLTEQLKTDVQSLQQIWDKLEKHLDEKRLVAPEKIRDFVKKGIPQKLRGDLWQSLVGSKNLKNSAAFDYQEKLNEVRAIMVDHGVTEYDNRKNVTIISRLSASSDNGDNTVITIDEESLRKLTSFRQILLDAAKQKRKLCENSNERPRKVLRPSKESVLVKQHKTPSALLGKFTGFMKTILRDPSILPADANVNSMCSKDVRLNRCSGDVCQATFHNLRITSPLRRSPRLAKLSTTKLTQCQACI